MHNTTDNDELLFYKHSQTHASDELGSTAIIDKCALWKIMIIDDDDVIHDVSHLVLSDLTFEGKPLEIIDGYSANEAKELIKKHPDTALILLDVVMETDQAGLDVVKYIRKELDNQLVRIILRTGQPAKMPDPQKYMADLVDTLFEAI